MKLLRMFTAVCFLGSITVQALFSQPLQRPPNRGAMSLMLDEAKAKSILETLGIGEGSSDIPESQYKLLVKKIQMFPLISRNVQKGAERPIPLDEWKKILTEMGITPAKELRND